MKKGVKIAVILVGGLLLLALLAWLNTLEFSTAFVGELLDGNKESVQTLPLKFSEPDYESDIFSNPAYLDKNRYIQYTDGALTTLITDENYEVYGESVEFFVRFFEAIIHGDHETYNSLFTEECRDSGNYTPYEKFTMQKVYNIEVEKLAEEVIEKGPRFGQRHYTYKVAYMIMENDGTFRNDMESDCAVPQLFELYYDGKDVLIDSIVRYTYTVFDD